MDIVPVMFWNKHYTLNLNYHVVNICDIIDSEGQSF